MVAAFLRNALLRESARTWPFMHDPVCDVAVACRLCPKSSVTCQSLLASKNAQITRAFIGLAFFQGNRSAVYICCICGSTTACQCLKNSYMHAFCSWANLSAILGWRHKTSIGMFKQGYYPTFCIAPLFLAGERLEALTAFSKLAFRLPRWEYVNAHM